MGAGPEILRDPDRDPHHILKIGTDQPDKGKHKITLDVNQLGPGGFFLDRCSGSIYRVV